MNLPQVVDKLRSDPAFMRNVTFWQHQPASEPRFGAFPQIMAPALQNALQERGIRKLYTHQAQAIEHILSGEHVAIVSLGDTPTKAALAALVDSAVGEHAKRPGRLRPALYRWEPEGRISLVADDLDTAAGRLAVRALVRTAEPSEL